MDTAQRKRRWRFALMGSSAVVVGLGAAAAVGYKWHFGRHQFGEAVSQVEGTKDNQSQFAKLMDEARQALAHNHPDVAVIFLKDAVAAEPNNSNARLQLGAALLRAGDAVSAERELRSAKHYGAPDESVLPLLFSAMLARSEGKQLLAQFPAPGQGDSSPTASGILRARAIAFNQTGDLKEAAASLDRALSFDNSAVNLAARAQVAHDMGDSSLTMKLVDEALSKSPKYSLALLTKFDLLVQAKQYDRALAIANDLVSYYPESPEARMARAGAYLELHDHVKALSDIDAGLKTMPNMALGLYYKARAMEQVKDIKQAWDLAQRLPPAFVNSRAEIGLAISQIAADAGHLELGTSILASTVLNFPKDVNARVRLAARYLQLKDAARALQTLQPMEDSSNPAIMVLFAQAYDMQNQYAKSLEYFEKARTAGVGGDFLNRQIGISNLEAGNLDAGIDELAKLNAATPGDPQTAGPLISALLRKNEFAKAREVAAKLEAAEPKNPFGPFYLGQLLLRQGDLDGAVDTFSRAIALDNKFIPALYERATALTGRGDLNSAEDDMRSILSNDPHNMMAQIKIAQIALQSGRREEAGRLLKDAVAANPDQSLPALTLARFDMQQGHLEDAATVVADFLNKDPNNADARAMQGELQLASGKPDQAVTTFRQLASTNPKSPQVQLLLATALAKAGKPEEATSAYRQAAQLAPMMQAAHLGLIQLALANKKDAEALVAAQSYAEKQPGPASASALAGTYLALSRIGDAVKVLSDTQAKYPNDATLISLTSLLRKQGDANAADTMLTDWITKYPEDIAVRMAYGESQLATNSAVAEAQYRAVLKSQPYNLAALNNLSWLLQQNDPKQALPYAERAAKMAPNSADVLDTLGWTRWQLNDKDGAVSLLQRAHAAQPKKADITFHLVIALDGTGRRADAKAMLDDLLASQQNFANKNEAEALAAKWQ